MDKTYVIGHSSRKEWCEGYAAGLSQNPWEHEVVAFTSDDCPLDKIYVVDKKQAQKILGRSEIV